MLPAVAEESAQAPVDALLGSPADVLRERHGSALRPVEVSLPRSVGERVRALAADPLAAEPDDVAPEPQERVAFAGQERLARLVGDDPDVARIEYDVVDGRVYRVRWQLTERFERPIMAAVVEHLRGRLGAPVFDQRIAAKLGSGKSDLWRARWQAGQRALDVRQLHPMTGGPLFVTLSDLAALQRIIDAGRVALPEPTVSEDWWRKPQRPLALVPADERELLLEGVDRMLERVGFSAEAKGEG